MTVPTYCLHLPAIINIHMYSRTPLTQHPQEQQMMDYQIIPDYQMVPYRDLSSYR